MAKGKKQPIYKTRIIEPETTTEMGWRVPVTILIPLIASHRISGKRGDIVEIPYNLVDELEAKKMVKR